MTLLDIFAGLSAEKRGFQPTHAAFGGAKPGGFLQCLLLQVSTGTE
jgi:hypothetical protein